MRDSRGYTRAVAQAAHPKGSPLGHLLVANPSAQSGKNADRIARARRVLDALGVAHDFLATLPDGGTVSAVQRELAKGPHRTVIAMGGDGTFAEAAKAILASGRAEEVRLAMLPTGTANDQGKSFGLSASEGDLERNAEVVAAGHETRLDAGRLRWKPAGAAARTEHFFDSASWGFGALVLARRNRDREAVASNPLLKGLWRDQLVYAGAVARSLLDPLAGVAKFDAQVEADGETRRWRGLLDLVVKGTPVYAGSWVLDRKAAHDDGRFEVVPFTGRRDLLHKALVNLRGAEALSSLGLEPAQGLSAARVVAELSAPAPAQVDGEELPAMDRFEVEVLKQALRLVVPKDRAEPKWRGRGHKK